MLQSLTILAAVGITAVCADMVQQIDDCPWYTGLPAAEKESYDVLFDQEFLVSLAPQKRCAYAGAVKDFELFLDSHPNSEETGTALAPLLLRQAFHSSGTFEVNSNTGGSNGATIRFAEELEDPDNACLKGAATATVAAFAARYAFVTQADAIVLGAYVALRRLGFPQMPKLKFKGGRIDSPWHIVYRARLPSTEENSVKSVFVDRMGFTEKEATALVGGAHNFGQTHAQCSGYVSNWTSNPNQWTVDERGSEFFRNLLEEDWKFFEICSYLNGTETRMAKVSPFDPNAEVHDEHEEEEGPGGHTLGMYLSQEPYVCEGQFLNSKGLMMLVSDFHLREAPEFKAHAHFYGTDTTDQLAHDFAGAFTKLVNFGLDRCGLFGGSCSQNDICVRATTHNAGDAYECISAVHVAGSNSKASAILLPCDAASGPRQDPASGPIWLTCLITVLCAAAVALVTAMITYKLMSPTPLAVQKRQKVTAMVNTKVVTPEDV